MKSQQPASQGRPVLNPPDNNLDGGLGSRAAEARAAASAAAPSVPPPADAPLAITHEVLRLLHRLADGEPKPKGLRALGSGVKNFSAHPMILVLITSVMTVFVGTRVANVYTSRQQEIERQHTLNQQELARQRSFTDELNKIRVQKIGEVWEHIDRTEVELDALLDRTSKGENSGKKDLNTIVKLVEEDVAVVNKNRFWLGESNYAHLKNYLAINRSYVLDKLMGPEVIDLSDTVKKREQAKQDVLQIRNTVLKGELEP